MYVCPITTEMRASHETVGLTRRVRHCGQTDLARQNTLRPLPPEPHGASGMVRTWHAHAAEGRLANRSRLGGGAARQQSFRSCQGRGATASRMLR